MFCWHVPIRQLWHCLQAICRPCVHMTNYSVTLSIAILGRAKWIVPMNITLNNINMPQLNRDAVFSTTNIISGTTGPNISLFVLILMYFSSWYQILTLWLTIFVLLMKLLRQLNLWPSASDLSGKCVIVSMNKESYSYFDDFVNLTGALFSHPR